MNKMGLTLIYLWLVSLCSCQQELIEYEKGDVKVCIEQGEQWLHDFPFSNGVYMQIVDKGIVTDKPENDSIKNNNIVAVRFVEHDIKANDTTCFNVVLPGFENYPNYYTYPDVFRYVDNGTSVAGVFTEGSMYAKYGTTDVPPGWLLALKYVTNYAHVRMIVPSKMGHQSANQYVNPYFYDIRKFQKALN